MRRSVFCRTSRPGILLIAAGVFAIVSCEQMVITELDADRIELSPASTTVAVSHTTQLTASVLTRDGQTLTGHGIEWSSLNDAVASVDNTGTVRGIAAGTALIRAAVGRASDTASVTVTTGPGLGPPAIGLGATTASFAATRGGANPQTQDINVTNAGEGTLSGLTVTTGYTSGQPTGWLTATLSGTTAPATLTLRATTGTLATGTYQATASVTSSVANNSPQQVQVTFRVTETIPTQPSNPVATTISATQINLSWTAATGTVDRYRIERKAGAAGVYQVVDSVSGNTTSYNNSGLAAATQYFYRVQACNAAGCSPFSAETSATTAPNPPGAPSGLTATAVSAAQINLSWNAPAAGTVDRYRIARRTGSNQFAVIDSVPASALTYQNAGLAAGTQYDYQVSACNAGGCSPFSATASATTPPTTPTGLTASGALLQASLNWTASAGNVSEYRIERRTASSSFQQIATAPGNATSYQDPSLLPGFYTFRIRACTATGACSAYSNEASVTIN